jgi:hypothetical protein
MTGISNEYLAVISDWERVIRNILVIQSIVMYIIIGLLFNSVTLFHDILIFKGYILLNSRVYSILSGPWIYCTSHSVKVHLLVLKYYSVLTLLSLLVPIQLPPFKVRHLLSQLMPNIINIKPCSVEVSLT